MDEMKLNTIEGLVLLIPSCSLGILLSYIGSYIIKNILRDSIGIKIDNGMKPWILIILITIPFVISLLSRIFPILKVLLCVKLDIFVNA
jgi:hypothetical protein